jgi:predicted dehydrogenase
MVKKQYTVLVVGCGEMGSSHARAYEKIPDFRIVGLVSRNPESRERLNSELAGDYPLFADYENALEQTSPEIVSLCTYPNTHAPFAIKALEKGCHLFVEKPLADTVENAEKVVQLALAKNRKIVVGYILRQHPSWVKFIDIAKGLGKPLVMRMNLIIQSSGARWRKQKKMMESIPPLVDCGVHYLDVMCQMTESEPVSVSAIGVQLSDEVSKPENYNYGHLQVVFKDGSVGWYEAGWGPMMSVNAFFVKDVTGPKGSASIVSNDKKAAKKADVLEDHVRTDSIRVHYQDRDKEDIFLKPDEFLDMTEEPDHDELCRLEQEYLLRSIRDDLDLTEHLGAAVNSMKIVLAADRAIREGRTIKL